MINSSAPEHKPVVIFDSGVGGLPYLEMTAALLPSEVLYYVADTAHYPYGDKAENHLKQIVLDVVGNIIRRFDPKCIVVACNTASVTTLAGLRDTYMLPFIGVVPAVKPAAEGSREKRFGVLATLRTARDGYLTRLINAYAGACQVTVLPAGRLRDIVENEFFSLERGAKIAEIRKLLAPIMPHDLDALVLGCTHFIHLEDEFKEVLGEAVRLIDSRRGVTNQLKRVLEQGGLLSGSRNGENCFYVTGGPAGKKDSYRLFAEKYGLIYKGEW